MAITYKAQAAGTGYGSGTRATAAGVNVAIGDLLVVGVSTNDSTILCTGVTDTAGNIFTLRDNIIYGNSNIKTAYCVATAANASDIFTAAFSAGSATKAINAVVFTIDIGDTVSLDIATVGGSTWEASPWETTTDTTTGDDAVAIAFFVSAAAKTYSNQEIPSGAAATVLTAANTNRTVFYQLLAATATIGAETDTDGNGAYSAEMLVFKSVAAGGTTYTMVCADSIALGDSGRSTAAFLASASDGLVLGDSGRGPALFPRMSIDSIALGDLSVFVRTTLGAATDSVALGDTAARIATLLGKATDSVALGDAALYTVLGAVEAFAADSVGLSDSARATAIYLVAAGDAITLGDYSQRTFTVQVIAADGVALGDATIVQVTAIAQAVDGISLSDAATALAAYIAAATDGIALQDVSISAGVAATGVVTVTFTTAKGSVTITTKRPTVTLTVKEPSVILS